MKRKLSIRALGLWIFFQLVVMQVVTSPAADPPITDVAFAPDGKSFAAISQMGVQVFSWPELERQRTISSSSANLHSIVFSPDGTRFAVGGGDPSEAGTVEVFSWPQGTRLTKLDGHRDSVRSVVWIDDERLVTASLDREIRLQRLEQSQSVLRESGEMVTLKGHSRSVDAICLLENGKTLVSSGVDQSLRVWNLESGVLIRSLNQHTRPVHALAVRPAQGGLPFVASAAGDRTIRFWQPTIGRMVRYVRLKAEPLDIAWLRDGARIVAACVDGRVRVVDPDEVKVVKTIPTLDGWVYTIAAHPSDGSVVVGGTNGKLMRLRP